MKSYRDFLEGKIYEDKDEDEKDEAEEESDDSEEDEVDPKDRLKEIKAEIGSLIDEVLKMIK